MYSLTVTAGWWLLPFLITLIAYAWAWRVTPDADESFLSGIEGIYTFGLATFASLVVWVVFLAVT
ncbi:MAG: hypothetical protein COA54_02470 [Thiotrichaceae bacterium]|nr:MAG: hypothetical protein COA54_02470 [Thiotrichaceae bacterium]